MAEKTYNYLFVSDFHIASGIDPETGTYHPREDFFYDREFLRFLLWADEHRETNGAPWELVFNGDCFDFLPIQTTLFDYQKYVAAKRRQKADTNPIAAFFAKSEFTDSGNGDWNSEPDFETYADDWDWDDEEWLSDELSGFRAAFIEDEGLDYWFQGDAPELDPALDPIQTWEDRHGFLPTPGVSVSRLELIGQGHPCFMDALAWWVAQGHRLVFLAGNHDLELNWPQVRAELRNMLFKTYLELRDGGIAPPCSVLPLEALEGMDPDLAEADFAARIDFHSWFYLKKGIFYAEHGNQYEMGNSVTNLLRPWLETEAKVPVRTGHDSAEIVTLKVMNHPLGSVIVESLVGPLEDKYPQWENVGGISNFVADIIRNDPLFMFNLIFVHSGEFWGKLRSLWDLTRTLPPEEELPTDSDLGEYAVSQGLPTYLGRTLHDAWSRPLLSYPWLRNRLFGPERVLFWLFIWTILILTAVAGLWLWFGVLAPRLTGLLVALALLPRQGGGALGAQAQDSVAVLIALVGFLGTYQLLKKVLGRAGAFAAWLASAFVMEDIQRWIDRYVLPNDYIRKGSERIHVILSENLRPVDVPYYYIMGHDHHPNTRIIERPLINGPRTGPTRYINTGSWLPSFSDANHRRLRTGGLDIEFTFFKIWRSDDSGNYKSELLRWNDPAGRAEPQVVPPPDFDKAREQEIRRRIEAEDESPLVWDPDEILVNYKVGAKTTGLFKQLKQGIDTMALAPWDTFRQEWDGQWLVAYSLPGDQRLCTVGLKGPERLPRLVRAIREHGWVRGLGMAFGSSPMRVTIPIAGGLGEAIAETPELSEATRSIIGQELERGNAFATILVTTEQQVRELLAAFRIIEMKCETALLDSS